jgi:hypothetical protein
MSKSILRIFAFFCLPFSDYAIAIDSTLSASQVRTAMQSERSKIASGRFSANGHCIISNGNELEKKDSFQWHYEFSKLRGSFLFDRSESCVSDFATRGGESDRLRVFFCEDSTSRYIYQDFVIPTAALYIQSVQTSGQELSSHFKRIEVQGLGVCNFSNVYDLSIAGDSFFFENSRVNINPDKDILVVEENPDILRLSFEKALPEAEHVLSMNLWVDRSRGFTPIRLTSVLNGHQEIESRSEWTQIGESWVPTQLTGSSSSPFIPDGKEIRVENIEYRKEDFQMHLSWTDVNHTLERDYDFQTFDFPKGTRVFKDGKLIHIFDYKMPDMIKRTPIAKQGKWVYIAMILGVSLATMIFYGVFIYRSKRR